nr:ORF2 [Torque teno felis virus]
MDPQAERRALHCAIWLQSCSRTHSLWCDCGLWTSHIKGWHPTTSEDGGAAADVGDGNEVRIDEFGTLVDIKRKREPDG